MSVTKNHFLKIKRIFFILKKKPFFAAVFFSDTASYLRMKIFQLESGRCEQIIHFSSCCSLRMLWNKWCNAGGETWFPGGSAQTVHSSSEKKKEKCSQDFYRLKWSSPGYQMTRGHLIRLCVCARPAKIRRAREGEKKVCFCVWSHKWKHKLILETIMNGH